MNFYFCTVYPSQVWAHMAARSQTWRKTSSRNQLQLFSVDNIIKVKAAANTTAHASYLERTGERSVHVTWPASRSQRGAPQLSEKTRNPPLLLLLLLLSSLLLFYSFLVPLYPGSAGTHLKTLLPSDGLHAWLVVFAKCCTCIIGLSCLTF